MPTVENRRVDKQTFRTTLGKFASGVTVITTRHKEQVHGMTASAFFSLSIDPPLVAVAVDKRARMHGMLEATGRLGISILSEEQEAYSQHFAGRPQEGLDVPFADQNGLPVIDGALAQLSCRVTGALDGGDHTIFVCLVESAQSREDREPLLYFSGAYRRLAPPREP